MTLWHEATNLPRFINQVCGRIDSVGFLLLSITGKFFRRFYRIYFIHIDALFKILPNINNNRYNECGFQNI